MFRTALRATGFVLWSGTMAFGPSSTLAGGLPEHPSLRHGPPSRWVDVAEVENPFETATAEGSSSTLLHWDTQLRVPVEQAPEVYRHVIYRLENQSGAEELSTWSLNFQPRFGELTLHELRVLRDGSWEDRLDRSRSSIVHVEEQLESRIYDESLSLLLIVDDLRAGDVLSVAYTVRGKNSTLGEQWADTVALRTDQVAEYRRLRALTEHPDLRFRLVGGAPEPTADRADGGWRELVWELAPAAKQEYEANVPWAYANQTGVQFSTFESWQEVSEWAQALFDVDSSDLDELDEVAARLRELPREEQLLAARNWVQDNVRYFAIAIGEHSHRPHRPAETLTRRYGDCKDKTIVLARLLDRLEIEAWPVLVNTEWRDGLLDFLPSAFAFDHVLVGAELDGNRVWIDPTLSHQGGRTIDEAWVPVYEIGLPLRAGTSDLVEMPSAQRGADPLRVTYGYRVDSTLESWDVNIYTVRRGEYAEAIRTDLDTQSHEEIQDRFLAFYDDSVRDIEVREPLQIIDEPSANKVVTRESYQVTAGDPEDGWSFFTLPLEIESLLYLPEDDRVAPLAIRHPSDVHETVFIEIDGGWPFEPWRTEIENPWFRFEVDSELSDDGRSFRLDYRFRTLEGTVPVAEFERYNRDVDAVYDEIGYALGHRVGTEVIGPLVVGALVGGGVASLLGLGLSVFLFRARLGGRALLAHWQPARDPSNHTAVNGTASPDPTEASTAGGSPPFRDPSRRVRRAIGAVLLVSALQVTTVFVVFLDVLFGEWAGAGFLEPLGTAMTVMLVLGFLVAGILFIEAQREFLRNLQAFGLADLKPGVSWSSFAWIVPFANLFVPRSSFGQIGLATTPPADRSTLVKLLNWWWWLWVSAQLTGRFAYLWTDEGLAGLATGLGFEIFSMVTLVFAGAAAATLLLVLRDSQRSAATIVTTRTSGSEPFSRPSRLAEWLYPPPEPPGTSLEYRSPVRPIEQTADDRV